MPPSDRLARSLPDAREILDELTRRPVKLSLGGSLHDPNDPVGRLLFNVLAMVASWAAPRREHVRVHLRLRPDTMPTRGLSVFARAWRRDAHDIDQLSIPRPLDPPAS